MQPLVQGINSLGRQPGLGQRRRDQLDNHLCFQAEQVVQHVPLADRGKIDQADLARGRINQNILHACKGRCF